MRNLLFALALGPLLGTGAAAQVILKSELELYEQSIDGQSAICGIQFTFAFKDDVYGAALPGGTTGSISYAVIKGTLVTMFKVVAMSGPAHVKIHSASVKADGQILKPSQIDCQD